MRSLLTLAALSAASAAKQRVWLTQDGGCTPAVGDIVHVTAHYETSDGGTTAGLAFNLHFDTTKFAFVGKAEASLPECDEHSLFEGRDFVAYSCVSTTGDKVLRSQVSAVAKVALKVLAPGGTITADPNDGVKTAGYTYDDIAPLAVRLCAAGETPAPVTAPPTPAPATTAPTMLSAIRGGNDQQEDAAEAAAADETSSAADWAQLAREQRQLVKELAARQTALELQQAELVKHQRDLDTLETKHNTDVLHRVGDLTVQHQNLVSAVQLKNHELLQAQKTHAQVLRKMQVPDSVIKSMYPHLDEAAAASSTSAVAANAAAVAGTALPANSLAPMTAELPPPRTSCGPVPVPGNGYKLAYNTDKVGGTVKFACQLGFFLIGSEERECLDNFKWSGTATFCEPFSKAPTPAPTPRATTAPPTPAPTLALCPNFKVPANAQISLTTRVTGGKVHFNCNAPFLLIGPSTATCMASGQWTVFPACIGKIEECSHLKCALRTRQLNAYTTESAIAVKYDKKEKRGTRHHCQFRQGSQDGHDCKCWCWFDSKLAQQQEAERRATEERTSLTRYS